MALRPFCVLPPKQLKKPEQHLSSVFKCPHIFAERTFKFLGTKTKITPTLFTFPLNFPLKIYHHMKVLNLVLAVLFILFAVVQYNDPDPWGWAALYLYVAAACGMAAFGKSNKFMLILGLGVSTLWMLTLVPDFIHWVQMGMPTIVAHMKAEAPHIELTREFLGLVVCMAALGWQWYRLRKSQKA